MANTLLIKRTATPGKVPTLADLQLGELGINTFDGKIFLRKDNGTPSIIEMGQASGGVTDHGALTGLGDDDHALYHTDARGDARYAQLVAANEFTNWQYITNNTDTLWGRHLELKAIEGTAERPIYLMFHQALRWYQRLRADANGFTVVSGGSDSLVNFGALALSENTVPLINKYTQLTQTLANSVDLNTLSASGFYRLSATPVNGPGGWSIDWSQLIMSRGADTAIQITGPYNGSELAFRAASGVGSTPNWSSWKRLWHENNFNPSNYVAKTTAERPGVTKLYRRDDDSRYNVQASWSTDVSGYWSLRGYYDDTYHAGVWVARAGSAATADSAPANGGTSSYSTYWWSVSHNGSYYLRNDWDGTYWNLTSNHSSGVRVAYADNAGNASNVTGAVARTAKTWVSFAVGTGVPTILSSYQLSSITDLGTGNWTINFSVNHGTSYSMHGNGFGTGGSSVHGICGISNQNWTGTTCTIASKGTGGTNDPERAFVSIFL